MNSSEIIDTVLDRCGRLSGNNTWRGYALAELNMLVDSYNTSGLPLVSRTTGEETGFYPWFLMTERAKTRVNIDDSRVEVPSDFIIEEEETSMELLETDGETSLKYLDKVIWDWLDFTDDAGEPNFYAINAGYFWLAPVPDKEYYLRFSYPEKQGSLTDSTSSTNKWTDNIGNVLVEALTSKIAGFYLYNNNLASNAANTRNLEIQKVYNHHVARKTANRSGVMGEKTYGANTNAYTDRSGRRT